MCGISGILGNLDREKQEISLQKMVNAMRHRGPDAAGTWYGERVALGHRRLSIIDLSTGANQPMMDPLGRYILIYNGEIYNFKEIASELLDYTFQTTCDTEVIIAAYEKWGEACLEKFNGMFAFAIWDKVRETLFVARDRLGIKPLYYWHKDGMLVFASEVRSLLASDMIPRCLDRANLEEYFQYYSVNDPKTLVKDVKMLPAGSFGTWEEGKLEIKRYWRLEKCGESWDSGTPYEAVCSGIREKFFSSVEKRLMSDVPFGAFLSGGIDSSAIVATMAQVSNQKVNTFSVVFDDSTYDESSYAKMISQKYNTEHHPLPLRPKELLAALPGALTSMDHPSGDGLNSYVVSQATKEAGFTVALSGLGGDELFAGYPVFKRYVKMHEQQWMYKVPKKLRGFASGGIATIYNNQKTERLREFMTLPNLDFSHAYPVFRKVFGRNELTQLINIESTGISQGNSLFPQEVLTEIDSLPLLSQVTVGELSTYTKNVLLRDTDQMSMAHSLEVRVPFFDHELVEYVLSIPDQVKYPTYSKKLFVDAMGELLPKEIVFRPKMGFMFPWESWLKNDLRSFCEAKISDLGKREVFNDNGPMALWNRFLGNDPKVNWIKVWMMVVLENWISENNLDA